MFPKPAVILAYPGRRFTNGKGLMNLKENLPSLIASLARRIPKYEWSIDISAESLMEPSNGWLGTGRSLVKALLCLYAIHKPKSFDSGQDVIIDNSWLKVSTRKNYHHFFPIAYMKKAYPGMGYWEVNHILNITIVDDFLKGQNPS